MKDATVLTDQLTTVMTVVQSVRVGKECAIEYAPSLSIFDHQESVHQGVDLHSAVLASALRRQAKSVFCRLELRGRCPNCEHFLRLQLWRLAGAEQPAARRGGQIL